MEELESKKHEGHSCHSSGGNHLLRNIGSFMVLAAIAYWLFTEHRAHVIGFLPFIILLACPVMHLFMHRGHGHHHHGSGSSGHSKESEK